MKHPTLGRCVAGATAALVAASIAPAVAAPRVVERVRVATRYLAMNQQDDGSISGGFSRFGTTADAVLAFVAAQRGQRQINRSVAWLEANVDGAATLGLKAKAVLAAVAANEDPRSFGGRDLVQEIQDTKTDEGHYGGESDTEVAYHALAMLALAAAGADVSAEASQWLRDAQCDDGGWQFDEPATASDDEHCFDSSAENDFSRSDTNTTAYAVMALDAAPGPGPAHDPAAFFASARDEYKKGWVYDPSGKCTEETLGKEFCYLTDANSTALVLQAHRDLALEEVRSGRAALMRLQYPRCGKTMGAFAFTWLYDPDAERFRKDDPNVGATVAAVQGAVRFPLPPEHPEVTKNPPNRRPCRS